MPKFTRVSDVFAAMPVNFQPDKADGLAALVAFELDGDDAGRYWVHIERGSCRTGSGAPPRAADATVRASGSDWLRITNGELNPVLAGVTGKIKVEGEMGLALKLASAFPRD
jgi:putative sterol carrier protein